MKKLLVTLLLFGCVAFSESYHGMASYYTEKDNKLNGHNKTANGETYNENAYTCASNKHRFGTLLRVENKINGKVVICRVNDRGVFHKYGRTLDLSKASFRSIANLRNGIIRVKITPLK